MAKQLLSASVAAPGFYGLNLQESSVTLAAGFALQADNCVIDEYGRLGARKGKTRLTTNVGYDNINFLGGWAHKDIDGTVANLTWNTTGFYKAGTDLSLPALITNNGVSWTNSNWDAETLTDYAYFFQRGETPKYYDPVSNDINDIPNTRTTTVTITHVTTTATVTHTAHGLVDGTSVTIAGANEADYNGTFTITVVDPNSYTYTMGADPGTDATGTITATHDIPDVPKANVVLSAYGRLWIADTDTNKTTVYWSDLLDGHTFDRGTAGSIDLSSVLVRGNDEIVALGAHAGRLIVFCKRNVVIFGDTDADKVLDPVNMQLVEVIKGTGCVARDSVRNTGSDVIFLSTNGLMSLGRLIQEKSQPMRDLSKNVRDDLVRSVQAADPEGIRSLYCPVEAFYLLLIPELERIYCFDARSQLQDGSARVTVWDQQRQNNMLQADCRVLFFGTNGISEYSGYSDEGESYVLKYFTNYFDFGDSTNMKILKRLTATVIGGNNQSLTLKAGFDYYNRYRSYAATLENLANYEYGVAEYGIAEYSTGTLVDQIRAPMGGDGNVIQMGVEATIDGEGLSIQRLDIYVKQGRTY